MTTTVGFLFPGQGAQFVGMGKDLAESFPAARKIYEEADAILGYPLSKICWEGSDEDLTKTLHAQPGIFVTSLAALSVFKEKRPDIAPSFSAGLSLGEFTALVAAGSISFEEGLKLVQIRATAMETCAKKHSGTMASIMGLSQPDCFQIAKEAGCEIANLNAPDQTVLSGEVSTVQKACELAEAKGAKRAIMLKVGGAFHSSLMAEAKEELEKALANTRIEAPKALFVANAVGQEVSTPEEIRALLARQLVSPVHWTDTMELAGNQGIPLFIEIGPGKVLKGLARKNAAPVKVECLGTLADFEKIEPALNVAGTGQ